MRQYDPFVDGHDEAPCLEHPFMDFVAAESHVSDTDRAWDHFINRAEGILGFELDGDEDRDGYSIDGAYAEFEAGVTAAQYAKSVRDNLTRLGKPTPEF